MMKHNKEYEKLYEQYKHSGFEFGYSTRIGKSKIIFEENIKSIPSSKRNHDDIPLFVKCNKCDEYMDFQQGKTVVLDGRWICPVCGNNVRERTVYNQIERENFNDNLYFLLRACVNYTGSFFSYAKKTCPFMERRRYT